MKPKIKIYTIKKKLIHGQVNVKLNVNPEAFMFSWLNLSVIIIYEDTLILE